VRGLRIRSRLIASGIALLVPVAVFISLYFPSRWAASETQSLRARLDNTAKLLALGVGQSMKRNDFALMRATLDWVRGDSALAYVVALDPDGEIIAELNPAHAAVNLPVERARRSAAQDGNLLRTVAPIEMSDGSHGTLLLGFTLTEVALATRQDRELMLLLSAGVLALGSLAAFGFASRLARPILRLRDAATRLASGDYDVGVMTHRTDEIGELGQAFQSMIGTIRDKTHQLEAQALELAAARDLAVDASRSKSDFLATMSHEIRTPMNGVIGMLELVLETELATAQRDRLSIAHRSADALLAIINSILDFSKIESGKLELEQITFDLHSTLEDVADLMAPRAAEKGLEFVCVQDASVPRAVRGDPGRVRQVLLNLASNATKFTSTGEIVLRVAAAPSPESDATLRFTVSDTGIGMSPSALEKLFTPFTQADASTTRRFGGTGLGLSISRRLVELMRGEMGVTSVEGEGSTFWFTVPLALDPVATPAIAMRGSRTAIIAGKQLLIVDAHAATRESLASLLSMRDVRVTGVADHAAALEACLAGVMRGDAIDAVLVRLDADLAATIAFADFVRQRFGEQSPAVIALDSASEHPRASEIVARGFTAYLQKPVRQSGLDACLRALFAPNALDTEHTVSLDHSRSRSPGAGDAPPPGVASGHGTRILVAEDNEVNQLVTGGMLESLGYVAEIAPNGREALRLFESGGYALVLMDCFMPEMDGFAATRAIRLMEAARARTPIIAMTANAVEDAREQCLNAGMDDFLTKPVRRAQLEATLEKWIATTRKYDTTVVTAHVDVGTDDMMSRWTDLFFSTTSDELAKLDHAMQAGDATRVHRVAHSISGAAGTVGVDAVAACAARLESAATSGDWVAMQSASDALHAAFALADAERVPA
jgi:two-component system, sensor histidine kinase and response regulator